MFPKYQEIQIPLLAEIKSRGGQTRPSERNQEGKNIYEALADVFNLPVELRSIQIYEANGTPRSKWENMVRWARNDLKKQGYLEAPSHGIWQITNTGKTLLADAAEEGLGKNVIAPELFVSPEKFKALKATAEWIGQQGERYVYELEKKYLLGIGKSDLAQKVKIVSEENIAAGYDILSFDAEGNEKFIEVKTSAGKSGVFEITANEIVVAKKKNELYWIYRVTKIQENAPEVLKIQNPAKHIDNGSLLLKPTAFTVTIGDSLQTTT